MFDAVVKPIVSCGCKVPGTFFQPFCISDLLLELKQMDRPAIGVLPPGLQAQKEGFRSRCLC